MGFNRKIIAQVAISLICSMLFIELAHSRDFGVVGHTYAINEQDILEYIKRKLGTLDLEKMNQEMQDKVRSSINRPQALLNITDAQEAREHEYDPTYTLDKTITDHTGKIIHIAGTTINPLEKVSLSNALLFIDGDNRIQVDWALKEHKRLDTKAKIILTKGSPIELQKAHKIWIYFDQFGEITSKLSIKHVPAIVTQEGFKLKIREIRLEAKEGKS